MSSTASSGLAMASEKTLQTSMPKEREKTSKEPIRNRINVVRSSAPLGTKGDEDDNDIAQVIDSGRIIESDQILSLVCPSSIYMEPRLGTQ